MKQTPPLRRPRGFLRHAALLAFALGALAAWAAPRPDDEKTATITMKGVVGQYARYQSTFKVRIPSPALEIEFTNVSKSTVTEVAENGEITFESESESSTQKVNGNQVDVPKDDEKSTIVQASDGSLVKYEHAGDDPTHLNARLFVAGTPVFPAEEIKVGSTWTRDYEAVASLGTPAAKGTYELVAFEKVGEVETAKITLDYKESGQGVPIEMNSTLWVELSSGDLVKSTSTVSSLPFPTGEGDAVVQVKGEGSSERIGGSPVPGEGGDPDAKPKPKTIEETVKGHEKLEGLFTLYRKTEDGRDTIFLELKRDQLGKYVIMQTTAETGDSQRLVAGDPISDLVFQFREERPGYITLVVPNEAFRADPSKPINEALRRSFADAHLETYKIEAEQPERNAVLINVSELFTGDLSQISEKFSGGGGGGFSLLSLGGGGYSVDREKTYISQLKSFPENLFVETVFAFQGSGGGGIEDVLSGGQTLADPRSIVVKAITNVYMLPVADGYTPRRFDPRVGYFTVSYTDWNNDKSLQPKVQNILRWDLRKKDPSAEMSEPEKPIVFWLDSAIPEEYRDPIRDGVLAWNKTFEPLGIKNAIVVNQMEPGQFDQGDMRYNVIRWVVSPSSAYAVALFRPNPLTGEILNASITVDANMARSTSGEMEVIVNPASAFDLERPKLDLTNPARCTLLQEGQLQARIGEMLLQDSGLKLDKKRYMAEFMRHVVQHEFGHILGLRHNFVGSTELDLEHLGDAAEVDSKNTSASVMDYVPFNLSAVGKENVPYWGPDPGKYDFWAIEYGYKPDATPTELKKIASRNTEPGLAYQSDETADGFDPYITRFDLSARPIEYFEDMIQVSRRLIGNLDKRRPVRGESYWTMTRDFNALVGMLSQGAAQASRYVGGIHLRGNFHGDANEKPTLEVISQADQKKALQILNTYVFSENAFAFPKRIYQYLTPNPNGDMMMQMLTGPEDYPVMDRFASIQSAALHRTLSPTVLSRVSNNEFKARIPSQALTLAEVIRSTTDAIWSELKTGSQISPLRRALQRDHIETLAAMALEPTGMPNDAQVLAWSELRRIAPMIQAAKGKATDPYTPTHLSESLTMIQRILNAQQTIGSVGGGGGGGSLLDLLLGGRRAPAVRK